MKEFSELNARLNIYISFAEMDQEDKNIRFVLSNISDELYKGKDGTLSRIVYEAQIKEINKAKQFVNEYGTKYFFEFCQDQIGKVSKDINKLLQLS